MNSKVMVMLAGLAVLASNGRNWVGCDTFIPRRRYKSFPKQVQSEEEKQFMLDKAQAKRDHKAKLKAKN